MKLRLTIDGKPYEVDVEVASPEPPHPSYVPPVGQPPMGQPPVGQPRPPFASTASAAVAPVPAASTPGRVLSEDKVCRSPIAGLVVRVAAKPGQSMKAHDVLLVLEAMKMETVITSPVDGQVAQVNVGPGDSVKQGQLLVEFA